MKHTPRIAALGALVCLAGGTVHAQTGAGNAYYQIQNDTLSGGGLNSIASDVTFTNLSLLETFSDGTSDTKPLPLFDFSGTPTTTLDTGTIFLTSNNLFNPDPTHGAVTLATLTGIFDNGVGTMPYQPGDVETVDTYTDDLINGATSPNSILAGFTASLSNPTLDSAVTIYATDAKNPGTRYTAGVFSLQPAVPEPSDLALLSIGLVGVGAVAARRRAAKTNN